MSSPCSSAMLLVLVSMALLEAASAETFHRAGEIYYGYELAKILNGGKLLTLSLDNSTGSGYQSTKTYLFGEFNMNIKLVPNNSAGTVATFYLSSQGSTWDEIDFEFLGNLSGQPYTIHTNIYTQGQGNREQQFHLWFDPTAHFHKYTVIWNPQLIMLLVDDTPIRVFNNNEAIGAPFPTSQAMNIFATIWDADSWVTQGGRVKTNWTEAPFTASYKSLVIKACEYSSGSSSCGSSQSTNSTRTEAYLTQSLDSKGQEKLSYVQENYMIYNYCTDYERFPQGLPPECSQPIFTQ